MSEKGPDGPYVYQPYGSATHREHNRHGRLWGVGGVPLATITGLTKSEATSIVKLLRGEQVADNTPTRPVALAPPSEIKDE